MKNATESEQLRGCDAHTAQQRNNQPETSNPERNTGATNNLKALARMVLERNRQRNRRATGIENTRNYGVENRATVADQTQPAVVSHGRTFCQCPKCKRMGWYPQASAEICCGMAMERIDQPTITIDEYVRFIHCPKSYASGAITDADIIKMMEREGIQKS